MVRLKARYVLFEIIYPGGAAKPTDGKTILKAVRASIASNFGEFGMGQCQSTLALRYFNPSTTTGILRIGREQASLLQGALTYIRGIDGVPALIRVRHISGTIRKSEDRALDIRKKELLALNH